MQKAKETYAAFLRGINVGGHHKVPMAELRKELEKLHFENVVTLLNSGNILFDAHAADTAKLEQLISAHLEKRFRFPVPTIIQKAEVIGYLVKDNPFKEVEMTKDIRLYVSFLQKETGAELKLPRISSDASFKIIDQHGKIILSVLDVSLSQTTKAMDALKVLFGKDITTRNWNTIKRIEKKYNAGH